MTRIDDTYIQEALEETHAVLHGHFQLTSGRHSDTYVQCARILEQPRLTAELAEEIVARLPEGVEIDTVVAPAVGGIIIGFAVALALDARFIFAERKGGVMELRRSFTLKPGERVLVVEDVVTTGGSVAEVIKLVQEASAEVVGVASLIDRGGEKAFQSEYWPLVSLDVSSWDPSECNPCKEGIAIDSPGSRRLL